MNNENIYFLFKQSLTFKPPDNWNQFALPMVVRLLGFHCAFFINNHSDLMLSTVLNVMRTKVGKCHKLQFCFSDRLFFYFINFLQRHVITAKLVTAVTSSCLIQRLKANGYRNPDHSRALSKLCYGLIILCNRLLYLIFEEMKLIRRIQTASGHNSKQNRIWFLLIASECTIIL